jgi:hypothetical protein
MAGVEPLEIRFRCTKGHFLPTEHRGSSFHRIGDKTIIVHTFDFREKKLPIHLPPTLRLEVGDFSVYMLKETRVTPFLLLLAVAMIPLFIFLAVTVKSYLSGILPVIGKIPTSIVFLGTLYPVYALYERFNGLIMFNKGNLQLKKKQ